MTLFAAPRRRFARRVVALFILSALLPIIVLTTLSSHEVRHLLREASLRTLEEQGRDIASTVQKRVARVSAGNAEGDAPGPDQLWNVSLGDGYSLCVFDGGASQRYCSRPLSAAGMRALAESTDASGTIQWTENGVNCYGYFWTMRPASASSGEFWRIVLSVDEVSLLAPHNGFSKAFSGAAALALALVALLSLVIVRRCTTPLARLISGTRALAAGDFSVRVELDSDDEFGELAESFNTMSGRIGRQFRALETMASLDRLILSSTDPDRIVEVLMEGIPAVVDCDGVMLARVADAGGGLLQLQLRTTGGHEAIETLPLESVAWSEFATAQGLVPIQPFGPHAPLLQGLPEHAPTRWLVLPVRMNEQLVAILGVGLSPEQGMDEARLEQLQQLAARAAVAFSNVAWERKLYHQAHYDALTDLPNRALLQDRLAQALQRARRDSSLAAVLFLDLDHFKSVNDLLGHAAGDRLLVHVARRLEEAVRSVDTVVRFGGDEFVVITPDLPRDDRLMSRVSRIAESLLTVFDAPFDVDGRRFEIGASIGISVYPRDASSIGEAVSNADAAMYHAKTLGRGHYQFFSRELNAAASVQMELAGDLRRALDDDELTVHYQPKLDPHSARPIGAECLVRWDHPRFGPIEPLTLLPVAEDAGLMEELGTWVIRTACAQLGVWAGQGHGGMTLSVNLSAREFRHRNIVDTVRSAVMDADIDPSRLELEVSEPMLMRDPDRTHVTLTQLAELGVQIFIDDFGTAHSSIAQLAAFRVHGVKVHGGIVRDAVERPQVRAVVAAVAGLARSLSLRLVATGVETREQAELVRELGFDECQGHFYGCASTIHELDSRLNAGAPVRLIGGTATAFEARLRQGPNP